ncbi:MAG: biotin carboxylase N-terminal domain-containing protein, partial [Pseudomonadales bacterium]|nr:biotin carboxylase N-terminal domain-containing protein [Pseudomonadales bacterium]
AVHIGTAASADSYLRADRIIQACHDTGAEAIHPGYGFLSENADFCESLASEGIAFIGPGVKAINSMGDKITSKRIAEEAGVNTIPGYTDVISNADHAVQISQEIGYPVMLKASAGGGGKGMRVVRNDDECRDGFERATNEAKSSFGDDRVFAEKFIEEPRHIEIQVLADNHGNAIYLGERECSIQRRHQKVIEEAPSPFLDEATRKAMGEQAVALARAVDYSSAGTVEFIVDADKNFFFLEMNTRLQVEHPVTEFITGQDLVEHMIKIAYDEKLMLAQEDVKLSGWSLETRVYAEDPFRNFLPSIGRLSNYVAPTETDTVRVDTGIEEGSEVSIFYDPMIAKLVTYGQTRDEAIENMAGALDAYYIRGVNHNISFLNALIMHPRFKEGRLTTNFIAEEYPDGFHAEDVPQSDPLIPVVVAASIHSKKQARAREISGQTRRFEIETNSAWVAVANDRQYPLTINAADHGYDVNHEGSHYSVQLDWQIGQPIVSAVVNGQAVAVQIDASKAGYRTFHRGAETQMQIISLQAAALSRHMIAKIPPDLSRFLLSPMPGLLIRMSAKVGEEVKAGEELAVVEAMKMENSLRAEEDVVIAKVMAQEGDSLTVDQTILEFE